MPERKLDSTSGGFGVAEREGIGVTEREMTPDSLLSFDSKTAVRTKRRPQRARAALHNEFEIER